jgi:hypothetical protein
MPEDIITESTETEVQPESQKRIQDLSNKVKTASEERDAEKLARQEAEKKVAFAEGFVDVISQNPAAKDFKEDIRAKVMGGYSMEDATYAVLGKAGKLGQQAQPVESQEVAGGSASTVITQTEEKTATTMTQAERRAALADSQSELMDILTPRNSL